MTCPRLFQPVMTLILAMMTASTGHAAKQCADVFIPRTSVLDRIILEASNVTTPAVQSAPHGMAAYLSFELATSLHPFAAISGARYLRVVAKGEVLNFLLAKSENGTLVRYMADLGASKIRFEFNFPNRETPIYVDLTPVLAKETVQLQLTTENNTVTSTPSVSASALMRKIENMAAREKLQSGR